MFGYDGVWGVEVVEPPAEEPVSLDLAKLHCKVDSNEEDVLIELAIAAAREQIESATRRSLVTQTLRLSIGECPMRELILPRPPLASVLQIAYLDDDGEEQIVPPPPVGYTVDRFATPGLVRLHDGARCVFRPTTVDYIAGYGPPAKVPAALRQAILLLVGDAFNNREAQLEKAVAQNDAVRRLIAPYLLPEIP